MRKVCVFTGTRAEFGLLHGVMQGIQDSPNLILQIIATGTHLSPEFGMTIQEIRDYGFEPDETVEILLSGDTPTAVCKSMGLALIGYGESIQRLQSDIVVLLGDRFETFCMAAAAQVCRVPVAHSYGGETTERVVDEAFRHSITKMSHLHFASCEAYRQRIIQLGESPDRVFNVGALGVENIHRTPLMSREGLAKSIEFTLNCPYFLVTFHPVTLEQSTAKTQIQALLAALENFPDCKVIFTKANADTEGRIINYLIDDYVAEHPGKAIAFTSMGTHRYLSAMKHAGAVVGNSSSGIIEAPTFKVPTVNIGNRQMGRVQAPSIINCESEIDSILNGIVTALSPAFIASMSGMVNSYDRRNTCSTIVGLLKNFGLEGIINKSFYDLPLS